MTIYLHLNTYLSISFLIAVKYMKSLKKKTINTCVLFIEN